MNGILIALEEWLITFLIGAATLVIFMAVVHRFLSGIPLLQDYAIVSTLGSGVMHLYVVWMAKFCAAYGVENGTHVGVNVLVRKLKPETAKYLHDLVDRRCDFHGCRRSIQRPFCLGKWLSLRLLSLYGLGPAPESVEGPASPDLEIPT